MLYVRFDMWSTVYSSGCARALSLAAVVTGAVNNYVADSVMYGDWLVKSLCWRGKMGSLFEFRLSSTAEGSGERKLCYSNTVLGFVVDFL